ncbi:unnamed protein product [Blepharisma stoltei]|uniref:Kelch repeat-containing protein n=1 Tax=Blepharisma stoltei TaxID=1481888 RepID=A0AAU9KEC7_9CILI|nr:unnamed protein product [Blepharisma stoltei]
MEQLGDIAALYNSEKEKNLLLERKLTACKKIMQKHVSQIESLKISLEHLAQIIKTKDKEIKWLYEELGRLGISETISSCLKIDKPSGIIEKEFSKPDEDKIKLVPKVKDSSSDIRIKEIEQNFIRNFQFIESKISASDPSLKQDCFQNTSLYLIGEVNKKTSLIVYNTEEEKENVKLLDTSLQLSDYTCIAQLPDNELFCFGNFPASGITSIIDRKLRVRILPSGTACSWSSAIYFNRNVYCFGGSDNTSRNLSLSERFNLDENRWIKLCPMPWADACCHSLIFNENVLIAGKFSWSIWLYSIATDSFSKIPYDFEYFAAKILINAGSLYLIESGKRKVYESEFGNEYVWKPVGISIIPYHPTQMCCLYNKGEIYIGCGSKPNYFKFNLSKKVMIKL